MSTITPFLERDRELIQLSDRQLRHVLADVHRWIGEKAFYCNERALSRKHFGKSLRLNWRQARCLGMFLMTCLPSYLGNILRSSYRAFKAGGRPR